MTRFQLLLPVGKKIDFFGQTLHTRKFPKWIFSGPIPTESLRTQDPENIIVFGDRTTIKFGVFGLGVAVLAETL